MTDTSHLKYMSSLIIKKCIVGTLSLGLAGSGTNKFSSLRRDAFARSRWQRY